MKAKLINVELTISDVDTGEILVLTCGKETDFGWKIHKNSTFHTIFVRYQKLMISISEFLREEMSNK